MGHNKTILKNINLKSIIGLWGGFILAVLLLIFGDLKPDQPEVIRCAAVAVLMAVWWITEAIPIPATALIPVALFPALGVLSGKETAQRRSFYLSSVQWRWRSENKKGASGDAP